MSVPIPGTSDVVGDASAPPSAARLAPMMKVTRKHPLGIDADGSCGFAVFRDRHDDGAGKGVTQEVAQPEQGDHGTSGSTRT